MGVGKTEVGKSLAEKLAFSFLDTDNLIEEAEGKKITQIFKDEGEQHFRKLETEVLETLQDYEDFVLSTGGGIVLKEENVALLREMGKIILLKATPEVICERLKNVSDRPLLAQGDRLEKIKEILSKRDPIYNSSADLIIETSEKTIEEIVEEIINYAKDIS